MSSNMNFKRFGNLTLNLNQISSIEQFDELPNKLLVTMTNGRQYSIDYSYNQLMSYLQYLK